MNIIEIPPEDNQVIWRIHRNAIHELFAFYSNAQRAAWTSATPDDFKASIQCSYKTAALKINETIVGYAFIRPKDTLWHLYICPTHQGKGYGKSLLRYVENVLIQNGINELKLHANDSAIGFYEKQGYTKGEQVFIPMKGEKISTYKMMKRLV